MTASDFLNFHPQFAGAVPPIVLQHYVTLANARFDEFAEDTEEARRLYIAHKLTLWVKTVPVSAEGGGSSSTVSTAALAAAGDGTRITGKRVENVSVTYSSGGDGGTSGSAAFEELTGTIYGQQLLSLLKLCSWPRYVP